MHTSPSIPAEQHESALDVDNYPVAPPELNLEQVHIYVRHGERAPVGQRLTSQAAGLPEHWLMCKAGRAMRALVVETAVRKGSAYIGAGVIIDSNLVSETGNEVDFDPHRALSHVRRAVERKDGTTEEGECMLGELTDLGRRASISSLSGLLRRNNITQLHSPLSTLGLLYGDYISPGSNSYPRICIMKIPHTLGIYLSCIVSPTVQVQTEARSTNMPRTIESLQHILYGLYPTTPEQSIIPKILIRNAKDENVLGNMFACRRLELMNLAFAQAAADVFNPLLAELDPKVSKYVGGPLRIDGKPRASGVLDTLRAAQAHNIKVPGAFKDKSVLELLIDKYHEFRRLAMGRLLDDLQRKMSHKAVLGVKDPLKILIHSTHDTALAGLCATLDVFDHRWPPFTAAITFELFSSSYPSSASDSKISILSPFTSLFAGFSINYIPSIFTSTATPQPKLQHFIRMRYQNHTLPLPICAEHGKHLEGHPEFCKLEAFREAVKNLIPDDFDAECLTENVSELGNRSVPSLSPSKAQAGAAADTNSGS